jgi:hypothetical protein
MVMETSKILLMPYNAVLLLSLLVIASPFLIPANYLAYAHTFSSSESAEFMSLVDRIRAETQLVTLNLENNNVALAQTHAQRAAVLPDNLTLSEIRERNTRIADSLENGLAQLEANVTSLTSGSQEQIPPDTIQAINESVMSLNDTLSEAVTVRVESDQQNNATMWALVLADLVNTVLADYGNATGAPFDLTDVSNLAGMEGMQMNHTNNNMTMMMDEGHTQTSANSSGNDVMSMERNSTAVSSMMSNMTTSNIVEEAAYQSAQYVLSNTILRLFTETLKPLSLNTDEIPSESDNATSDDNATVMTQEEEQQQQTSTGNLTSNIDKLEAGLILLRDNIENKATPTEVMTTAHLQIHPLLMQMYGLTTVPQEGEQHSQHTTVS